MKKLLLIAAACLAFGCVFGAMWDAATSPRLPREAKITRAPSIAEFNELKAQVKALEEWAQREGMKY